MITASMAQALARMQAGDGRLVRAWAGGLGVHEAWTTPSESDGVWRASFATVKALERVGLIAPTKTGARGHVVEYGLTDSGRSSNLASVQLARDAEKSRAGRTDPVRAGEPQEPGKSSPSGGAEVLGCSS